MVTSVLCFSRPHGNLQYRLHFREQFQMQNGVKDHVRRMKWYFNYVSLHKNNFSSNLNHDKFAYFLFGSEIKL
jgi:hypothetical protein